MNERDTNGDGGDDVGFDGEEITANEATGRSDFAGMVTTRAGSAICKGGALAGRLGDSIVEFGRDVPANERPSARTMRLIAEDARVAAAIEAFCDIIQNLRDVRNYLQEQAAVSHENEEAP